jgi:hypothetical protein
MSEFVLNRNYALAGFGHMITFIKGQPTHVPPRLEAAAIGIGATPVDGKQIDVLGPEEDPAYVPAGEDRTLALYEAFDTLIKRNGREDFTGSGSPTVKAVEKLTGFDVDKAELTVAWTEYRAKAAE